MLNQHVFSYEFGVEVVHIVIFSINLYPFSAIHILTLSKLRCKLMNDYIHLRILLFNSLYFYIKKEEDQCRLDSISKNPYL